MKICKDGRIWGQTNKEAGNHLGILTGRENAKGNYIKKGSYYRSKEHRKKLSEMKKGKIGDKANHWKGGLIKIICEICGKEKYIKPSIVKQGIGKYCSYKCRNIWVNKHSRKKDTSIEIAIEKELIERNIPYLKQAPIEGIALVDFLLSNRIIIQCDGDYWHSRELNKGRDIAQDTELFFKGYKIFRFSETEINKSAKKCVDKII